jgi:hypothetical protein
MLQPLRYLHDCSDCFRLERLPGGVCTHWKAPPLHGAHPSLTFLRWHRCISCVLNVGGRQSGIASQPGR